MTCEWCDAAIPPHPRPVGWKRRWCAYESGGKERRKLIWACPLHAHLGTPFDGFTPQGAPR